MKHPLHRLISVVLLLALASSLFPASAAQASVKIGDQLFFHAFRCSGAGTRG